MVTVKTGLMPKILTPETFVILVFNEKIVCPAVLLIEGTPDNVS